MSFDKKGFKKTEIGLIPEDWQYNKIENYLEKIIDYRGKTPKKSKFGILTLSAKSIKRGRIDYNQTYTISKATFQEWETRGKPKIGDVLLTTEGPLGEVAQIDRPNVAVAQRLLVLRGKENVLDNNYLKYYLMSRKGQEELHSRATGTTVQGIKQSEFRKINIIIPLISEQKAIAKILSDLDDKIELNNEMNKTLEEIAQALFKRWFIDFEFPDANGNPYRSSGGDMVFSEELGKEIPKEWEVDKLGNHVNLVKGVSYRSEELTESENALVTLKSIDRKGNFKIDGLKEYVGKYKDEQILFSGDIVVAHTDLTQKADVLGNPAIVREVSKYEKLIASLDLVIVRPKNEYINRPFIYHLLKTNAFHNHAIGYANGTTVLHLNHKAIPDFEFVVPSFTIIKNFGENINQITLKLQDNELQSECLAQIRDFILPKLMSGEIRVPLEAIQ